MSQRILDEREHRRGLVLGLTLAEVLVLLLFLLLLALGHRLNRLHQTTVLAEKERYAAKISFERAHAELTQLKLLLPKSLSEMELRALLIEVPELKQQISDLRESLHTVQPALAAAASIDPSDPPALLKRGLEMLTTAQKARLIQEIAGKTTKIETASINAPSISKDGHNWPPIISLSEAKGYFFSSGSAEVSQLFQNKLLNSVVADLVKIIELYKVDVVEIVGHTDEQKLVIRPSNLDTVLVPFLRGDAGLERFMPSDNAGLGLARAAAVLRVLADDPRLKNIKLLPLSGGQVIEEGDALSTGRSPGNVKERRRIEIRARRSDEGRDGGWRDSVTHN